MPTPAAAATQHMLQLPALDLSDLSDLTEHVTLVTGAPRDPFSPTPPTVRPNRTGIGPALALSEAAPTTSPDHLAV